jgi:hypothetical protein
MAVIGKVESLWRYPVKSMRGEELHEAAPVSAIRTGQRSQPTWPKRRASRLG